MRSRGWRRRVVRVGVLALSLSLVLMAVGLASPAVAGNGFRPGSPGLGDPFFPLAGNGGYDVSHYSLRFAYDPATVHLDGTATIRATATQNLSRFDLDLRGFRISRLLVNGQAATVARAGQELIITPPEGLPAGRPFTVVVGYAGRPSIVTDPDRSIEGWVPTRDGAFVVGEPQGSPGWYPANDNPQDKATFDFAVTVPAGLTVLANGVLASSSTRDGQTTWVWHERFPMAPYLATATLGRFNLTRSLETQTKPVFDRPPDETTLAHETSHMWFGDSVTLARWPDIWLHEGFATWSEWIWSEHEGRATAHQIFRALYRTPASDSSFWTPPPNRLGTPVNLFNGVIYERGAMTLQALREKVGDGTFFRIMRDWAATHRYGNATTAQFVALAERDSGRNLHHFFAVWLDQPSKPASW